MRTFWTVQVMKSGAPAGDEGARRRALDARAVPLVSGVVGTHPGEARGQILQLVLGPALVDLVRADRLSDEHPPANVPHLREAFADRVPMFGASGPVDALAG